MVVHAPSVADAPYGGRRYKADWVTLQAAPTDSTFLKLAPVKHIDLRTRIY